MEIAFPTLYFEKISFPSFKLLTTIFNWLSLDNYTTTGHSISQYRHIIVKWRKVVSLRCLGLRTKFKGKSNFYKRIED
jgi:hypothetical protein